jgi:RNA polymerase sigma-70 factor, ECF subfamily
MLEARLTKLYRGGQSAEVQGPKVPAAPVRPVEDAGNPAAETTLDLLARVREGDSASANALFERCLPSLRRWARGRLPHYARDLADTQDLVQETILHALRHLDTFEARHQGALQAYLRRAIVNRIRDEIRRVRRRPALVELENVHADPQPSPVERAIGREGIERYEAALERLKPSDREAIVARMELQQSYEEVAVALGKPNANAARVAVTRALARLIQEMSNGR